MRTFLPALISICAASYALAGDPLTDVLNAEKTRIAEAYKTAAAACDAKPAKEEEACKKTADKERQAALKAASKERDLGLKCKECGVVSAVNSQKHDGESTAAGAVAGGAAGAVIGRQVAGNNASSSEKNVATVIGAVGGALLGKKIEEKMKKHTIWQVEYKTYGGDSGKQEFKEEPPFKAGDKIKLVDGKLVKR